MKIVIDTNVFLMSLPKISKYRPIFDSLINGEYSLAITEDIYQEYIEIIGQKTNGEIAKNFGEFLTQSQYVEINTVYYRWNLIEKDPDDNKFVDCAIAAKAKFIVSNDKHFNILKTIDFPNIEVIKADDFLQELTK